MSNSIENKVANSGLINISLDNYYIRGKRVTIDLKSYFSEDGILREKEFRSKLKETDWSTYENNLVAIDCSADAIVPLWAYMLVASYLEGNCSFFHYGNLESLESTLSKKGLEKLNPEEYKDKRVIVNGCGQLPLHESAFVEITKLLQPVAKSIMFGEACSTVPIFKKKTT